MGPQPPKGRNIARQPRVSLCIQDDQSPFSYVTIEGPAELIDDAELVGLWAARIGGRYMGLDRAAEYGARNGVPGELLVRVQPASLFGVSRVAD